MYRKVWADMMGPYQSTDQQKIISLAFNVYIIHWRKIEFDPYNMNVFDVRCVMCDVRITVTNGILSNASSAILFR